MTTPEEKAKKLVQMMEEEGLSNRQAKECALICVESEKQLLASLYDEVTKLEFEINRDAWRKWRVSIENAGIENEQIKNSIEKI